MLIGKAKNKESKSKPELEFELEPKEDEEKLNSEIANLAKKIIRRNKNFTKKDIKKVFQNKNKQSTQTMSTGQNQVSLVLDATKRNIINYEKVKEKPKNNKKNPKSHFRTKRQAEGALVGQRIKYQAGEALLDRENKRSQDELTRRPSAKLIQY